MAEREVRKANRELHTQTAKMSELQKIDHLTKRCSDLLSDMKRHERESIKNKKRGDQLQKDKDSSRNELNKTVSLKEKLEKLCRELQRENNKLKVRSPARGLAVGSRCADGIGLGRTRTRLFPTRRSEARTRGTKDIRAFLGGWTTTRKKKTIRASR